MGQWHMNIVFALSLLLAAGFATARLVRLVRLPGVTGYILAGMALGPSGFDIIGRELSESRLEVFTNIAIMLVAFGIGERFDLQQLRRSANALARVSIGEVSTTFVLVWLSVSLTAWFTATGGGGLSLAGHVSLGLVAASIAVATAPASTVAVLRESEASGPISRLLLSSVVVNNALSVTLFGIAVAAAGGLLQTGTGSGLYRALSPMVMTGSSLLLGILVGFVTDLLVHRLTRREEVLIVALAAVFFTGGLAGLLGLSALLAGVAAGFAVVNRDRRDVRAFRALNDFEPPIYGIFFALAGAQLHLAEMASAGWLALAFVLARIGGKYFGAWAGARQAGLDRLRATSIGMGLLPQAGLAIALAYVIRQEPSMVPIRDYLLNVIIASVVINELIGPPLVNWMAARVGEIPRRKIAAEDMEVEAEADVSAWKGSSLRPARHPNGYVLFGLSHPGRAAAVTRLATLLSHEFRAMPLAVHVVAGEHQGDFWSSQPDRDSLNLFQLARREAQNLGYPLKTYSEFAEETAEGIVRAAESVKAQAIVLGHPLARRAPEFARIVDAVARDSLCPVVVAKMTGRFDVQNILVAVSSRDELYALQPFISALSLLPQENLTVVRLMPHETSAGELEKREEEVREIVSEYLEGTPCRAVATESRVHRVLSESERFDMLVMSASGQRGLRRVFFGSLAEDVALRIKKPMLIIRSGVESRSPWSA